MGLSLEQWKNYRFRFAWGFVISFAVLAISMSSFFTVHRMEAPVSPSPPPLLRPFVLAKATLPSGTPNLAVLISVASLLTSGTTLVGFFVTTAIAWRKERREQQQGSLDLEIKRLELERLRIEVERQKPESSPLQRKPNDLV